MVKRRMDRLTEKHVKLESMLRTEADENPEKRTENAYKEFMATLAFYAYSRQKVIYYLVSFMFGALITRLILSF